MCRSLMQVVPWCAIDFLICQTWMILNHWWLDNSWKISEMYFKPSLKASSFHCSEFFRDTSCDVWCHPKMTWSLQKIGDLVAYDTRNLFLALCEGQNLSYTVIRYSVVWVGTPLSRFWRQAKARWLDRVGSAGADCFGEFWCLDAVCPEGIWGVACWRWSKQISTWKEIEWSKIVLKNAGIILILTWRSPNNLTYPSFLWAFVPGALYNISPFVASSVFQIGRVQKSFQNARHFGMFPAQ